MSMRQKFVSLPIKITATLAVGMSLLLSSTAKAADRIEIRRSEVDFRSLSFDSLEHLAKTGDALGVLSATLEDFNESPADARRTLTEEASYPLVDASTLFNSAAGDDFLEELTEIIVPEAGGDAKVALRSAILQSLVDDNTLTILEVLENYPVNAVIDLDRDDDTVSHFTGLESLVSFFSSSVATNITREREALYVRSERRVAEEWRPSSPAPATAAPVRALW